MFEIPLEIRAWVHKGKSAYENMVLADQGEFLQV